MRKAFASEESIVAISIRLSTNTVNAQDNSGTNSNDEAVAGEIVVTGSQIARAALDVADPVVSVSRDAIDQSGQVSLDEILSEMPQMGIGFGASNTFFNYDDPGAAFANLRSLGTNRSLVLVNGRRRVSGSRSSSAVDLNSLAPGMIERVEIISGGASAIYGADAVSGVINLITRKDKPGFRISGKTGISENGDAATRSVNAFGGTTFPGGRGKINAGVNYSTRKALMFGDRKFSDRQMTSQANTANTGPNDGISDLKTWDDVRVSYITPDASVYMGGQHHMWTANGLETVTGQLLTGGAFGHNQGGNAPHWYSYLSVSSPLDVYSGQADISFDITPNIRVFAEGEYSRTASDTLKQYYRFDNRSFYFAGNGGPKIKFDNPYLPSQLADMAHGMA
ncbi:MULTISPECIES: TonB-dependent siderophore receptor [unclassified Novosphingobium]|uniref:TonB-dependent receptor plug domain-containing protein n=1 Tax=unclassified Novosphingobium TaxID=2644732 RepID=UPI00135810B5|nr:MULTISPECIES: TonB-dependent receptor plug domain-containing protein [unclassified Novosphingobium]